MKKVIYKINLLNINLDYNKNSVEKNYEKESYVKEMRMMKNRIAAKKCREKKKCERISLEEENKQLKQQLEEVKKDLYFCNQLENLKAVIIK